MQAPLIRKDPEKRGKEVGIPREPGTQRPELQSTELKSRL